MKENLVAPDREKFASSRKAIQTERAQETYAIVEPESKVTETFAKEASDHGENSNLLHAGSKNPGYPSEPTEAEPIVRPQRSDFLSASKQSVSRIVKEPEDSLTKSSMAEFTETQIGDEKRSRKPQSQTELTQERTITDEISNHQVEESARQKQSSEANADKTEKVEQKKWVSLRKIEVKRGETLAGIASKWSRTIPG